jgi:endoglucanase
MRRGVNLGNALEAPNEGDWGYRIEAEHLRAIADAGFDGVRLPVRWDAHAQTEPPYAIAADFFARVDQVIEQALGAGLKVQLDLHHYEGLVAEGPASRHRARFLGLWTQIARRYADGPPGLMFEPFNEPNGAHWTNAALSALQREVVQVIRERNSARLIVLGPGNWQNIDALHRWRPPAGENLAASFHYYEPHAFTHQDAEWLGAEAPRFDHAWGSQGGDELHVARHIIGATVFGNRSGLPLQLGEFGVNRAVPAAQRAAWTRFVREQCERNGIAWCVWDFAGAFPVWDRERGAFIPEMLEALLG